MEEKREGEKKNKRKRKMRRREAKLKRYGTMTMSMDSSKIWYGSLVLFGYYLASNLGFVRISS